MQIQRMSKYLVASCNFALSIVFLVLLLLFLIGSMCCVVSSICWKIGGSFFLILSMGSMLFVVMSHLVAISSLLFAESFVKMSEDKEKLVGVRWSGRLFYSRGQLVNTWLWLVPLIVLTSPFCCLTGC
jgi:hypothetical protein